MQQRHRWVLVGILSLFLAVMVGACGDDDGGNSPGRTANVEGDWRGTWRSTQAAASGALTATFTQSGGTITGHGTISNSPCGQQGTVTGSVDGMMFEMRAEFGVNGRSDFVGDVAEDENSIRGTYSVVRGQCRGDRGTFRLDRE